MVQVERYLGVCILVAENKDLMLYKLPSSVIGAMSTAAGMTEILYEHSRIEDALHAATKSMLELETEMKEFVPRPLSDFEEERRETRERAVTNWLPQGTPAEIDAAVDGQIKARAEPQTQFLFRFDGRFNASLVTVSVVSHSLCEALINSILAIGLAEKKTRELFNLIERAEIVEKWLSGPKALNPEYELPKGEALYGRLKRLSGLRNVLVHSKVGIMHAGKEVFEGTKLEEFTYQSGFQFLKEAARLPYDLHRHYLKFSPRAFTMHMLLSKGPPL